MVGLRAVCLLLLLKLLWLPKLLRHGSTHIETYALRMCKKPERTTSAFPSGLTSKSLNLAAASAFMLTL